MRRVNYIKEKPDLPQDWIPFYKKFSGVALKKPITVSRKEEIRKYREGSILILEDDVPAFIQGPYQIINKEDAVETIFDVGDMEDNKEIKCLFKAFSGHCTEHYGRRFYIRSKPPHYGQLYYFKEF